MPFSNKDLPFLTYLTFKEAPKAIGYLIKLLVLDKGNLLSNCWGGEGCKNLPNQFRASPLLFISSPEFVGNSSLLRTPHTSDRTLENNNLIQMPPP